MSPEKIDLSKINYNGPMTVVGYPDFSAIRPSLGAQARVTSDRASASADNQSPSKQKLQRKPRI